MVSSAEAVAQRPIGLIAIAVPAAVLGLLFIFDAGLHEIGDILVLSSSILYAASEVTYGLQRAILASGKSNR